MCQLHVDNQRAMLSSSYMHYVITMEYYLTSHSQSVCYIDFPDSTVSNKLKMFHSINKTFLWHMKCKWQTLVSFQRSMRNMWKTSMKVCYDLLKNLLSKVDCHMCMHIRQQRLWSVTLLTHTLYIRWRDMTMETDFEPQSQFW